MTSRISCDVTKRTHKDKLAIFSAIVYLVKPCLRKPHVEAFNEDLVLIENEPRRDVVVSICRDMEWPDNWTLDIYMSTLFRAMTDENLVKLLMFVKEFDMRYVDPDYEERARYESRYKSGTNPDWKALGFVDENPARMKK